MEEAVGRVMAAIIILWFINLTRDAAPTDQLYRELRNIKNETSVFENRTFGVNMSYVRNEPPPPPASAGVLDDFLEETKVPGTLLEVNWPFTIPTTSLLNNKN